MAATKQQIAELVKSHRAKRGLTQLELAELVGISLRSIQRIESGDVMPRYYTLKLLGNHLQFSAELLRENTSGTRLKTKLNLTQRILLSVVSLAVIFLLAGAFLAQSAHFPETQFELFLFLAVMIVVCGVVLFWIWR